MSAADRLLLTSVKFSVKWYNVVPVRCATPRLSFSSLLFSHAHAYTRAQATHMRTVARLSALLIPRLHGIFGGRIDPRIKETHKLFLVILSSQPVVPRCQFHQLRFAVRIAKEYNFQV
ncbi:hypothetical protein J6590_002161 [Homalodisca vitripennis]|nr:hypothetical protein J6590_002161 [Homalodisca vitripennis]